MTKRRFAQGIVEVALLFIISEVLAVSALAAVTPGEIITRDNASSVADLVSPGNFMLVEQGMRMKIVPTATLDWPPPYKAATEKYSPQVSLNERGELQNYVAGLPFPFLDLNDPQVATKIIWNFSYGPAIADLAEIRNVETGNYRDVGPQGSFVSWVMPAEVTHSTAGRVAYYNNIGRTEVLPMPTDPHAGSTGIRERLFVGPILEGGGTFLRYRYIDPNREDAAWYYALGRVSAAMLSNSTGPTTLDPDSYSGFGAKIEDFNYQLIGIKPMLASVEAEHSPAQHCIFDNHRTVCPENWEMRQLYIIAATPKPLPSRRVGSGGVSISKRILYIDSEGWFITASDQYDRAGALWKTVAIFNAYRDRAMPSATLIYPFKRMFETALVDEDIQSGFSTVVYMPGSESAEYDGWVLDPGAVTQSAIGTAATKSVNTQPVAPTNRR